jgi:hypothetical protein
MIKIFHIFLLTLTLSLLFTVTKGESHEVVTKVYNLMGTEGDAEGSTRTTSRGTIITHNESLRVGRNKIAAFQFKIDIPPEAAVENAYLRTYCSNNCDRSIDVVYRGEIDSPPFMEVNENLLNRNFIDTKVDAKTKAWEEDRWNGEGDNIGALITGIINDPSYVGNNVIAIYVIDNSSESKRIIKTSDSGQQFSPELHITYSISDNGVVGEDCKFDTNGDGFDDIIYPDNDEDGYCEVKLGTNEFVGTLVVDQKLELMADPPKERSNTQFRGDGFRVIAGGEVITDGMSPVPSSINPEFEGADLDIIVRNGTVIEDMGKVSLAGKPAGEDSGDMIIEAKRVNADIWLKNQGQLFARNIDLITDGGKILIEDKAVVDFINTLDLRTNYNGNVGDLGDIVIKNQAEILGSFFSFSSVLSFHTHAGDVSFSESAFIASDTIDFCDVKDDGLGSFNDDGTTTFIGTILTGNACVNPTPFKRDFHFRRKLSN